MDMNRDLSLGLILLAGLGLGGKAARGQVVLQGRDGNSAPCVLPTLNARTPMSKPEQDCREYLDYKPDVVFRGKTTVAVHRPPVQTWQPPADIHFDTTIHFRVKKGKDCATAFSLADKGTGSPAEYICENQKDHKRYAELQCDGNRQQNCYGLQYVNGKPMHAVLRIQASLQ